MRTDVRPDVRRVPSEPAIQPVRRAPLALVLTGLVLAVGLALSGAVSVVRGGEDGAGIRTAGGPRPTATVLGTVFTSTVPPDLATTVPRAKAGTRSQPAGTAAPTGRATTVAPPPATSTPPTTAASPGTTAAPQPTVQAGGQAAASTVPACRNSTDPACGEFSWDPQPGPYEVEVYAVSTPIAAEAGEPVTFAVDYVDPAGPDAQGACLNWWVSDPAVVNTSSCEVIATSCARTGPHDPPEPSRERIPLERTITFETPGEHEVRIEGNIATHLADGCESPYRNTFTRTFTITVR